MVFDKFKAVYAVKRRMIDNEAGMVSTKEIVALVIACLVIAYVLPTGLQALGAINTTGLSAGETALIGAFGIIIVIAIFAKLTE